jgi:subtilase family serine protease
VAVTDGGSDERGEPGGRPDLVIADFSLNPRSPEVREEVRVSFRVHNRGDGLSASCQARWTPVAGHPIPPVMTTIPALEPGADFVVRFTYPGYLLPFPELVTRATVDSGREIPESNEDNNSQDLRFRVRP